MVGVIKTKPNSPTLIVSRKRGGNWEMKREIRNSQLPTFLINPD